MNLDQLLKLENINNYQLWWYGKSIAKYYFVGNELKKEYVSFKGNQPDMNKVFILLYGIDGHRSRYMQAIKLVEKFEEEKEPGQISYKWAKVNLKLDEYSGRLILKNTTRFSFLNNSGKNFIVDEIYPPEINRSVPYFISYDEVELSFKQLKEIVDNRYEDYYKHLSCVKGIYMIIDGNTGKQYIGSAYGKEALYGRWESYAKTCHGGNEELIELFNQNGYEYFFNFKYIIIQILPLKISDREIIDIETKYKNRYLSKKFGLNKN